jgi:hypothetical protein
LTGEADLIIGNLEEGAFGESVKSSPVREH